MRVGDSFEILQGGDRCFSGIHNAGGVYAEEISFSMDKLISDSIYFGREEVKKIGKLTITKIKEQCYT